MARAGLRVRAPLTKSRNDDQILTAILYSALREALAVSPCPSPRALASTPDLSHANLLIVTHLETDRKGGGTESILSWSPLVVVSAHASYE